MSPGAKIFLTLIGVGGVFGAIAIAGSRKASAKPGAPPDVIVPDEEPALPGPNDFMALGIFTPAEAAAAAAELASLGPADRQRVLALLTGQSNTPTDYSGTAIQMQQAGRPNLARAIITVAGQKFGSAPSAAPPPPAAPAPAPTVPASIPIPVAPSPAPSAPAPAPSLPELPDTIGPITIPLPTGPVTLPPVNIPATVPPLPTGPVTLPPAPPLPLPTTPPAAPPAPPTVPVSTPVTTVSKDTAAMVQALLLAEAKAGWNRVSAELNAWQTARPPLTIDGKFGPKSALAVAAELGTVPLIRFWPKGSQKEKALSDYRAALFALANAATDPARASQLRFAAEREQAQAFGVAQGKAPAVAPALLVSLAKVA